MSAACIWHRLHRRLPGPVLANGSRQRKHGRRALEVWSATSRSCPSTRLTPSLRGCVGSWRHVPPGRREAPAPPRRAGSRHSPRPRPAGFNTPVLHTPLYAIIPPAPSIVRASTTPRRPSHRPSGLCRNFPIAKSTPSVRLPLFRASHDGVNFANPGRLVKRPPGARRFRQMAPTHRRAPTKSQRGIFASRKML